MTLPGFTADLSLAPARVFERLRRTMGGYAALAIRPQLWEMPPAWDCSLQCDSDFRLCLSICASLHPRIIPDLEACRAQCWNSLTDCNRRCARS